MEPIVEAFVKLGLAVWQMLDALFAITTDRLAWFRRLLYEPVTPQQISRWIGRNT